MKKKIAISIVAVALVLCCAIGGTLAWLTDKTGPVVNTFTVGDINIDLTETEREYKMVPGNQLDKDPTVVVKPNSEACYLFVKVEKSENLDTFVEYAMAANWTQLVDGNGNKVDGVFYRVVDAATAKAGVSYPVLLNNKVTVKGEVTKGQLDALTEATYPKLTFTAYAVQQDNIADAYTAWGKI